MSETQKQPLTADEQLKELERQTSFGEYFKSRVKKLAIAAAGAGVGAITFLAIDQSKYKQHAETLLEKLQHNPLLPHRNISFSPTLGALLGFFTSQFFNTYDVWKKSEMENRTVGKINRTVAERNEEARKFDRKFDETLNHQESVIKEILDKRQPDAAMSHADATAVKSNEPLMRG